VTTRYCYYGVAVKECLKSLLARAVLKFKGILVGDGQNHAEFVKN